MQSHEYRVVPAPRRGLRVRGARRAEERFARAVEAQMNRMASEGWDYVRSDTLPHEVRAGWFSRPVTVFETLLVFRRPIAEAQAAPLEPVRDEAPAPRPAVETVPQLLRAAPPPAPAVAPVAQVAPPPPPAARFAASPAGLRAEPAAPAPTPTLHLVEPAAPEPRPQGEAGRSQAAL